MSKKIISLLMTLVILSTLCFNVVYGSEIINISSRGETKISVLKNSNTSSPKSVKSNYMEFNSGEWAEFTVNFPKDGMYKVLAYACVVGKDIKVTAGISAAVLGTGTIKASKSWDDFKTLSHDLGTYEFKKGVTTVRLTSGGASHLGGIAFLPMVESVSSGKQSGAYKAAYLPTVINAENFDVGENGSQSVDGVNNGGVYRKDAKIDIKGDSQDYVIVLHPKEFVKYTFNVVESDVYALDIKASGNTNLEVYIDDMPYPVNVGVDNLSLGVIKGTDIYLEEGEHTIKLAGVESEITLDEIIFSVSDNEEFISVKSLNFEQPKSAIQNANEGTTFDYDSLDKKNDIYKTIYVSQSGSDDGDGSKAAPFKTLPRVLEELEVVTPDMTGDVVVNIESGHYNIDEKLKITNAHGGKNGFNVIWQGEGVAEKPVISGGVEVTGWEKDTDYIWKARVADDQIKEVRNLYVNDVPSIRARSKYLYVHQGDYLAEGSTNRRDGFYVESANFPNIEHPERLETVWEAEWDHCRHRVENIIYGNDGKNVLIMRQPLWSAYSTSEVAYAPRKGGNFYLENAKELLDEPGEFFFDDIERCIYYYPFEAEDMTKAETYIGKSEFMMDIQGESKENKVSNIIFDNISFKYGAWDYVSENGIHPLQAEACYNKEGKFGNYVPGGPDKLSPGQIQVNKAKNITIKNCEFACLGSLAMDFNDAVQNVKIEGNIIKDISGGAITIGTWNHTTANGSIDIINGETCRNFLVKNNVIRRVGNEYASHPAISIYYEADIDIVHNDISEVSYTGISVGWGWSTTSLRSSEHKNIRVTHNRITKVLQVMSDGAGVYTLGEIPGCVIAYNYLKDKPDNHGGSVYNDEGSKYIETHHNVFINNTIWYYVQSGIGADNNKVYSNYSDTDVWNKTGSSALGTNQVEEAIPIDPYNLLPEAQLIVDNAGVEGKYKYLLDGIDLPLWKANRSTDRATEKFGNAPGETATYGWIEAEDYMPGKNGRTYYKRSEFLNNNVYRPEGVELISLKDFSGVGNGYVVEEVSEGEWMKYKLLAPEDGEYQIKLRYSHGSKTPLTFNMYVDDKLVLDKCGVEKGENGWFHIVETDCGIVNLTAGEHIVKFEYIGGFYLDALGFINPNVPLPEKEIKQTSPDYDEGVLELEQEPVIEYEFMDIQGHWAQKDIMDMKDEGIINGISPTEFAPDMFLTREQAVWICMRARGIAHTNENWEDVALNLGMISKKGKGTEIVSREEFAHIVMKAYTVLNDKYKITVGNDYGDKELIDQKYYQEILGAREIGLMTGDENGNFRPKDGLTRAEAITVAKRLLN